MSVGTDGDGVIDADVLMNLVATNQATEILSVRRSPMRVCAVTERELIYICDGEGRRVSIDLSPLFTAGVLVRVDLTAAETARYVGLAAEIDDGEAQVLAVAAIRGLPAATDDRRARRCAERLAVPIISTTMLLRAWAESAKPSPMALRETLIRIERGANHVPARDDPSRAWWDDHARLVDD
jgi:hypothetical protein